MFLRISTPTNPYLQYLRSQLDRPQYRIQASRMTQYTYSQLSAPDSVDGWDHPEQRTFGSGQSSCCNRRILLLQVSPSESSVVYTPDSTGLQCRSKSSHMLASSRPGCQLDYNVLYKSQMNSRIWRNTSHIGLMLGSNYRGKVCSSRSSERHCSLDRPIHRVSHLDFAQRLY